MAAIHILAFVLTATTVLASPIEHSADETNYRLPDIYDLTSYNIELTVPSDSFTSNSDKYTGKVTIQFAFTKDTDTLYFHVHRDFITIKQLTFNNIVYDSSDYKDSIDPVTNILALNLVIPIKIGLKYSLIIEFEGRLSTTDMYGFYKSNYADSKGVTKYLATTQFEPTHARRAFPCFDEPALKATFAVTISYPNTLKVLFNTKVSKTSTKDGVITAVFEETPKMSVYLLAIVISEFSCTEGARVGTATYQVCSRDDTSANRKLAVEVGPPLLTKLGDVTAYQYTNQMKKMDQVAIPDFSAGAMENWGLITYRETALLWDEKESSNKYKQSITATIAHEFTHQWFGNLVTCKWWSETFLNEGFATYFQYFITHQVFPEWEMDKQFVLEEVQAVLDVDELENSQALQSDCGSPTEISAKFGDISYDKGASILRMVSLFLGEDNFVAGLREYLVNNQLKGAEPEQLWAALSTTVDQEIAKLPDKLSTVMENWTKKPGFPLVTVKSNGTHIILSQERFLLSGEDKTKWYVPISYTSSRDKNKFESTSPAAWLTPEKDLELVYPEGVSWLIVNNQEAGYYRVNYDDTLWGNIKTALSQDNYDGITEINRAQIVDDLFSLAKANKISYQNTFDITKFLINDTSYYTWHTATQSYDFLLRRVGQNSKLGKAISASLLNLMKNLYASVPMNQFNDTNQIYTLKQVLAWSWACQLGEQDCVKNSQAAFNEYKTLDHRPDKNLRSIIYCNALRYSTDATDWDFLWGAYTKATDLATERGTILTALGCSKDAAVLESYLQKTIADDSGIRSQDALSVFAAVYSGSPEGVDVAYNFLTTNYKNISDKYQSMNSLSRLIKGIAERFTTEAELEKLKDFISTGDLQEEFQIAATQAAEVAESNLNWLKAFEADLAKVFDISDDDDDEDNAAVKVTMSSFAVVLVAVIAMVFVR